MTDSEQARAARQAEKLRANLQKRKEQKRARRVSEGDVAAQEAGVTDPQEGRQDRDPTK